MLSSVGTPLMERAGAYSGSSDNRIAPLLCSFMNFIAFPLARSRSTGPAKAMVKDNNVKIKRVNRCFIIKYELVNDIFYASMMLQR